MTQKLKLDELGRQSVEEFKATSAKIPVVVVLDNIRSLHNVGSVFRTADAFAAQGLYLCGITGTPPHREIQKTALGATESIDWLYFSTTREAVTKLKQEGFVVCAVEQTSDSVFLDVFPFAFEGRYAFVFGNEVEGVSDDVLSECDHFIEIPQFGTKHSMNVSVTTGILLWDYYVKVKRS